MTIMTTNKTFQHLGAYSDLVAASKAQRPLFGTGLSSADIRKRLQSMLAFTLGNEQPLDVREGRSWTADGVDGQEVSWSVGYGPRTEAWILKPSGSTGVLPGRLALHDHGHFKFYGKEKIADGPDGTLKHLQSFRELYYGGRAFANAYAREGYVVVVHDVFLWGSRRFPADVMPDRDRLLGEAVAPTISDGDEGADIGAYNGSAYLHEHLAEKYCRVLGTTLAALAAYEDRVGLNYLLSRDDVDPGNVASIGLSGGGLRSALLRATTERLPVCAIAGMMNTYEELLDHSMAEHTWMLFPPGLSSFGDWPDLAASLPPSPLLVQYLLDDAQFTVDGMRASDAAIGARYSAEGARDRYRGEFYPGPHRFDTAMQRAALDWLNGVLRPG
jgi:hypothetical protein